MIQKIKSLACWMFGHKIKKNILGFTENQVMAKKWQAGEFAGDWCTRCYRPVKIYYAVDSEQVFSSEEPKYLESPSRFKNYINSGMTNDSKD